jgi:GT2 family glycosyltransferase
MKDLSIIIINYKTPSLLRQCIKSTLRAKPKLNYEIIVIDNNSRDGSAQMIEDDFYDTVILIANKKNLGFPKAVNQGIVEAQKNQSKYILLLNPDITVLPESLEQIFDFMEKNQDIAILGPQLINPDGSIQNSCFTQFTTPAIVLYRRTVFGKLRKAKKEIDNFLMANWDHRSPRNVAWILGSCMFVRMEAIKKIGPMDERFFMYMEDVDWCRRFWEAGYRVFYWPGVKMVHYYQRASAPEGGLLLSMFNRQTRIHIFSALKYFLKYWKYKDTVSEKLKK